MKFICEEIISNIPTINHRIYSKFELQKAIDYYNENDKYKFGGFQPDNYLEIISRDVAFSIKGLILIGDKIVINIKILDTPKGRIVKNILKKKEKLQIRFSLTGLVSEKDNNGNSIVFDLKILFTYLDRYN